QQEQQFRIQLGLARQRGEVVDQRRLNGLPLHDGRLDDELRRRLDERRQRLGQQNSIRVRVRDRRGSLEVLLEHFEARALRRPLGKRVLDDLVLRLRRSQLTTKFGRRRNVETLVVDKDRRIDRFERSGQV